MAQGSRAEKASTPSRSGASRAEAIDVEELLAQQQHRTGTSSGSTSRAGRSGGVSDLRAGGSRRDEHMRGDPFADPFCLCPVALLFALEGGEPADFSAG